MSTLKHLDHHMGIYLIHEKCGKIPPAEVRGAACDESITYEKVQAQIA